MPPEIDPVLTRLCRNRGLGSTDQDYQLLYAAARGCQASRFVEIGTHLGASGICLLRAALDNGAAAPHLWTIDNWQGPQDGAPGSAPQLYAAARDAFAEAGLADNVTMIVGDSRQVLPELLGAIGPFDMALIDGDHSAPAVWADFIALRHHAPRILFHDSAWASIRPVLARVQAAGWTVCDFPTRYLEGDGHPVGIALATAPHAAAVLPEPPEPRLDGYATHLPVLLACLQHNGGPILELGAGLFSTPLVHAFAVLGRYARTVECDSEWAARVATLFDGAPPHFAHDLVDGLDARDAHLAEHRWGVVLIDHGAKDRAPDLELVRTLKPDLVIVHDSEDAGYRMEPILGRFAHRYDYTRLRPHTTVASDSDPLDWLDAALRPLW